MNLTGSIRDMEKPHFYWQLGELIASTGDDHFATNLFQLVNPLVPVNRVDLSEWTLDERQASVVEIKPLGSAGGSQSVSPPDPLQHPDEHPLLQKMIEMSDSLLIQLKTPPQPRHPQHSVHQCNLVSRTSNRRCVISFFRPHTHRVFSLPELSFLKNLSDTLLPLIERHAKISRQTVARQPRLPSAELDQAPLQQVFDERLTLGRIVLSVREKEVCLGLLTGGTVPQMAEKLQVKSSSIQTYLKRATAKLGVSGRHGLAKWMAGA
ncbi:MULTISPECIES: helix-turn-helix transcriptional regulator [unclassified Pseudomonas]|jgi:DNA-binding CsgD family transcriptional regulator|uniref:helix-turn-helix transcriptional regulator n=1 Tax=unclassified Pseudomonas TaxID=196821 RepID=UPI000D35BAE1|nr:MULTISPECIES: helix-turn-helix transcriptional regulator [unclassified Pseudomonas]PTT24778.1 helix-turn-helix transcriptional regulator [Pseudomonas sp. HMWF021]HEX4549614.1 helix-turn-helix transcriptional regulator [Pseudomonas sp.]